MITTVSEKRSTDPRKLSQTVRGDLDWIVMKAMEKNRSRSYETANGFANDIKWYLNDEPVQARPPSTIYRLKKFSRRNRTQLTTSLVILLAIFSAVGFFAVDRAAQRRDRETRRLDLTQQINDSLTEAELYGERARVSETADLTAWTKARQMAERAETLSENELIRTELRDRVKLLLDRLSEEECDRRIVAAIEESRMRGTEVDVVNSRFRNDISAPHYERVFLAYGIDPQATTVKQAAERIRSRPPDIRLALIAGLDSWSNLVLKYGDESEKNQKTGQVSTCQ